MGIIGKDFKFKKVEDFLDKNLLTIFSSYCKIRHRDNFGPSAFFCKEVNMESSFNMDPLMEALLFNKKINRRINWKTITTYTFFLENVYVS